MYSHLKLKEWPFRTVPDENYCSFIADRTQFKKDIDVFMQDISIQTASSIYLMWAWYGAGKTHTCFVSAKFGQRLIFPKLRFEIRKPT